MSKTIHIFIAAFVIAITAFIAAPITNVAFADSDFSTQQEEACLAYEAGLQDLNYGDYNYVTDTDSDGNIFVYITKYVGKDSSVTIPQTINGHAVKKIVDYAFFQNTNIVEVIIPDGVEAIGTSAFSMCSYLKEAEIPDSVTSIGDAAFYATKLTSIEIPSNMESISSHCFDSCPLAEISIPSTATSIGAYAFYNNNADVVNIHENMLSIGEFAFASPSTTKYVVEASPSCAVSKYAFYNAEKNSYIYCTDEDTMANLENSSCCSEKMACIELVGSETIAGEDRYETATKIAYRAMGDSGEVLIAASGNNYPDALAATGLAGLIDAPMILVSNDLNADAAIYSSIASQSSNYKYAIIIGGDNAVSEATAQSMQSILKLSAVKRIAGEDRYDTACKIFTDYKTAINFNNDDSSDVSWGKTAIVATGMNYPDALAISSCSFAKNYPIFLVGDGDNSATLASMQSGGFNSVIIVGGEGAVSNDTAASIGNALPNASVSRWSGDDRYETSQIIANNLVASGMSIDRMCVATGANFPDALVGGVLAGKSGSILVLADNDHTTMSFSKSEYVGKIFYLGGENALSASVKNAIDGQFLPHVHSWETRYVIDEEAHTEIICTPIYQYDPPITHSICAGCGEELTDENRSEHEDHGSSYEFFEHGDVIGYDNKTVYCEEEGHYEKVCTKCGEVEVL